MKLIPQLLLVWILGGCYAGAQTVQLHPKFAVSADTQNDLGEYFTGSPDANWTPSRHTVLYHLFRFADQKMALDGIAVIENLPRTDHLRMRLKYICAPDASENVHELLYPFKLPKHLNRICNLTLPLELDLLENQWISDTSFKLHMRLTTPTGEESKVTFDDALTHYIRIQLEFVGRHWTLESNGLFIRNWDPVFRLNSRPTRSGSYPLRFFTDEAIKFMGNMSVSRNSGFQTMQFLHPDAAQLIRHAPEFVRATIGIGAMLSITSPGTECQNLGTKTDSITFMSKEYSELHYHYSSMSIMRLDSMTGKLTFSRRGLSALASQSSGYYICAYLSYIPTTQSLPYIRGKEITKFSGSRSHTMSSIADEGLPMDECHVIGPNPSNVTVFARETYSHVYCPIICAQSDQNYTFYRGNIALHPLPGNLFTPVGAISVHKSGSLLQFGRLVTHAESGQYKCTVGNKEATMLVNVVSLPLFSIRSTKFVGGELPSKIYVSPGTDYSVNCTVFHSGLRSTVNIEPMFHVLLDKREHKWSSLTDAEFTKRLKLHDSSATFSVKRTSYRTTLTLTVTRVPPQTEAFDFSHRFVCDVAVSSEDANRFGVSEYNIQSGSDVIVVPAPNVSDIESTIGDCCLEGCSGKNCLVVFSLKQVFLKQLNSIGVQIRGTFKDGNSPLSEENQKHVTFDKLNGTVIYETSKALPSMTKEDKEQFLRLTPVFEFFAPGNKKLTKVPAPASNSSCDRDPSCVLSTASYNLALSIGTVFKLRMVGLRM